jgi:hypothetical protein
MTARFSTGFRNAINKEGGIDSSLRNGSITIYSGTQPATADAAATGSPLCILTNNSGALTYEVQSSGNITLTGGAGGAVNTLTVNGVDILGAAVPFNSTLNQTALDVASQINRYKSEPDYIATASGAVVTILALPGKGTLPNGFTVAATTTTLTATTGNMAGGVAPVNGLLFDQSIAGVLSKLATQVWSGANGATGSAGWCRFHGSVTDPDTLDSTGQYIRIDGAVATSGAEMNFNSVAFVAGATTTLSNWSMTIPPQ